MILDIGKMAGGRSLKIGALKGKIGRFSFYGVSQYTSKIQVSQGSDELG